MLPNIGCICVRFPCNVMDHNEITEELFKSIIWEGRFFMCIGEAPTIRFLFDTFFFPKETQGGKIKCLNSWLASTALEKWKCFYERTFFISKILYLNGLQRGHLNTYV